MPEKITPFLMFQGNAGEALDFYAATIDGVTVTNQEVHGPDAGEAAGKVSSAVLSLGGQEVRVFDSPIKHAFSFTPSFSFFVDCREEAEIDRLFAALSEGGEVLMPLDAYDFSPKFAWVNDKFGVSWQLNLLKKEERPRSSAG